MPNFKTKIKHIVVLMLENRSFDHMLGYIRREIPKIEGLIGSESNPSIGGDEIRVFWVPPDSPLLYSTVPDPDHEFPAVNLQLFESESPQSHDQPTNRGFIWSYALQLASKEGPAIGYLRAHNIMCCFRPEQLPVLSYLAKHYTVCDRWFASVPGSTWPNRFFVHAGTSNGDLVTPAGLISTGKIIEKFKTYTMRTIYEDLTAADFTWGIYHHGFPQVLAFANLMANKSYQGNFKPFQQFLEDSASSNLPNYSFIEPNHFPYLSMPNDQHPPFDVRAGEKLIADVYNSLRSSKSWPETLLLVLYDEHGGFYDHVPPPSAARPDDKESIDPPFKFDRLGLRVPAIIISPYAPQKVNNGIYDHTSLLATVRKLFNMPKGPSAREAHAATFEDCFDFSMNPDNAAAALQTNDILDFNPGGEWLKNKDLTPYAQVLLELAKFAAEAHGHPTAAKFLGDIGKIAGLA